MPRASPQIIHFSSGELSPLLDGRIDLEEYNSGCRVLENFIPLLQGPAMRRGGTKFVREVKDSTDKCGFIKFQFNVEQAYVLEIGDQYMRFYTDHGIVLNGTNPLELATPWTAADLFDADGNFLLRSVQSNDVLYITHVDGDYQPQKLTRTSALSWSIADFEQDGGPFQDIDPDETITVYASAVTGSVSLVASSAIFAASHVGTLFLLEEKNAAATTAWEAGKAVTSGDDRRVDKRNYEAANSATTGTVTPVHVRGTQSDGVVNWLYLDAGFGWGRITAVGSSGTTATMTVLSRLPEGAVGSGDATTRWAFGEWSDANGWPTHVTFFRERLTFAKASTRQIWMSVAGDFENFADKDRNGEVVDDQAIAIEVTSDESNPIQWMIPSDTLIVGTSGGEFSVGEITETEPLAPGNVKADPQTSYGSKPTNPCRVGGAVMFVQRSGRKLRDFNYDTLEEGYKSANLSILSPHLLGKDESIVGLAYQQEPHSVVWAIADDGRLLATTVNSNKQNFGWHRHPIGGSGIVEAIETIPNPEADADELWMIVKRTINGSTKRYVEYMVPEWSSDEDIWDACYMDSFLTYDGAVAATLTPGTGATVQDTEEVTFTAGSSVFISGHIGREIQYRYTVTPEDDRDSGYRTARAEITAVNSGTVVEATILSAFPSTSAIASGGWKLSVTSISGLDHLEGETVDILANGSVHPQVAVASGAVTLQDPASYVTIGLPCIAKLQTMRLEAGSGTGTSQGALKRVDRVTIRVFDTLGGTAGPDADNLDEMLFRGGSDYMDESPPILNGDYEMRWPDTYTTDAYLMYVNDQPYPATVIAFYPAMNTNDR